MTFPLVNLAGQDQECPDAEFQLDCSDYDTGLYYRPDDRYSGYKDSQELEDDDDLVDVFEYDSDLEDDSDYYRDSDYGCVSLC